MKEASSETGSSHPRDAEAIPRLIMLLFVGAFAAGAVIGYFTEGFGFFARSSRRESTPASTPSVTPAPPPPTRAVPPPEPIAAPAPVTPRAPARVASPDYAVPVQARASSEPPASEGAGRAAVRVQVGAFRVRKNAEILVQRLEEDGFRAHIGQAGGLYKVRIGPVTSADDAKRLVKELRAKKYDAFVSP